MASLYERYEEEKRRKGVVDFDDLLLKTVELFEQYGFARVRQVGKHAWIVTKKIDPA